MSNRMLGGEPKSEKVAIDDLKSEDIEDLDPVLRIWVRDRMQFTILEDEINEIKSKMAGSIEGTNDYKFFVARNKEGKVIGMVGLRAPDSVMRLAVSTELPIELVNFFIDIQKRHKGVGTQLLAQVIEYAYNNANSEVIWNSGPRYKQSAWGFYDRKRLDLGIERFGVIKNCYNDDPDLDKSFSPVANDIDVKNGDAPVWRRLL